MNTLSPTTIGLELPGPSSSTRHLTFSLFDHVSGAVFTSDWPVPSGPRHCSQSPAAAPPSALRKRKLVAISNWRIDIRRNRCLDRRNDNEQRRRIKSYWLTDQQASQ